MRVLCVDDSSDDAELNIRALQRHGFTIESIRVDTHGGARDALRQPWDLVLCDYSMPDFSANGFLRLLAEMELEIPCLIVSGAIGEEAAVEAIRLGAYDYIFKDNLKRLGQAADRALRDAEIKDARRLAELRLRERETRLRLLFEQLPALVITADLNMLITSVEGSQLGVLGISPDTMIGRRIASSALIADESRLPARRGQLAALQGSAADHEIIFAGKTFQSHVEPLRDPQGEIIGTIAVALDITERKVAQQRLAYFSQYDLLTDLPNRGVFEDRLSQAIGMSGRHDRRLAVISIDLDRFKDINETYGQTTGDETLRAVGARLHRSVSADATVSRIAEDTFCIMLLDVKDRESVQAAVELLHDAFRVPFAVGEVEVLVTASIGVSLFPEDGHDAGSMIKAADAAMYQAKRMSRNTWQFFVPNMLAASAERTTLRRDLRAAIEREQLVVYYQPIFRCQGMELAGFEALVRWHHPTLGMLLPDHFIPLAEESGMIEQLGEWVLQNVCMQTTQWQAEALDVPRVCVNISARQFENPSLRRNIERILNAHGVDPSRIELELTESSILRDLTSAVAMLHDLKKLGVRLSVDDFGTGYTSLSFLRRFPIDVLKIDKSFVRELLPGSHDEAIVKAISTLAENLGLISVAEGIETPLALEQIRAIGCTEVQGYLLSRPLSPQQCIDFCQDYKLALG